MAAPFGVSKTYEDYESLKDSLMFLDIGYKLKLEINSEFPPPSEDFKILNNPHLVSVETIKFRLEKLDPWTVEVAELLGNIEDEKKKEKAAKKMFKFFDCDLPLYVNMKGLCCMIRCLEGWLFLCSIVVMFHDYRRIRKPRSPSLILYNKNVIANNHHTNNNPFINFKPKNQEFRPFNNP